MIAQITTIHTRAGELPGVIFFRSWKYYYDDDIEGLIIAHKTDDGEVQGRDFIEPDEEKARQRLREIAELEYPSISIHYS